MERDPDDSKLGLILTRLNIVMYTQTTPQARTNVTASTSSLRL